MSSAEESSDAMGASMNKPVIEYETPVEEPSTFELPVAALWRLAVFFALSAAFTMFFYLIQALAH
jgi:hypothetical protein